MTPSRGLSFLLVALAAPLATPASGHELPPVPPAEVSVLPGSTTSVRLFWTDLANNETGYQVEASYNDAVVQVVDLPANSTGAVVANLLSGNLYDFRVRTRNNAGFSAYSRSLPGQTDFNSPVVACQTSSPAPCLNNNRFQVSVHWALSNGQFGGGTGQKLGGDSAAFTFFNPNNQELLIKVLNACGVNGRYWVFASGLTDVEVLIFVHDRQRGLTRSYHNPQGRAFAPVQDTSAFATCP